MDSDSKVKATFVFRYPFDGLARRWCKAMHPDPMWPVYGRYRCPKCYRTYPIPWALPEEKPSRQQWLRRFRQKIRALQEEPSKQLPKAA